MSSSRQSDLQGPLCWRRSLPDHAHPWAVPQNPQPKTGCCGFRNPRFADLQNSWLLPESIWTVLAWGGKGMIYHSLYWCTGFRLANDLGLEATSRPAQYYRRPCRKMKTPLTPRQTISTLYDVIVFFIQPFPNLHHQGFTWCEATVHLVR